MATQRKNWKRSRRGRWVAGICAGLARRLGWRVSVVRTIWAICTVIPVLPGLPAYLVLWILLSVEEEPTLANELDAIALNCSRLPVLNGRDTDEILGYDENGLPG